jgi:hypothetical protein
VAELERMIAALRGEGTGALQSSTQASDWWVSASLGAGLWGWLTPRVALALDLDAMVAFTRPSFTVDPRGTVFSALPGGGAASFGEQLAFALDRPVRRGAKVATNNLADRVHWLRDDPTMLEGIRVVVYQVTARALASADWTAARIHPQPHKRRKP